MSIFILMKAFRFTNPARAPLNTLIPIKISLSLMKPLLKSISTNSHLRIVLILGMLMLMHAGLRAADSGAQSRTESTSLNADTLLTPPQAVQNALDSQERERGGDLPQQVTLDSGERERGGDLLTLQDAILITLERNFSIQIARNIAEIAALNRNPGSAGMTPRLDITAGYSGGREDAVETVNGMDGPSVRTTRAVTDLDAALGWTIFDGMKMFTTYEKLAEFEQLGAVQARIRIEDTLADLITAYYAIVRLERRLIVLQNTLEITGERLRIAETKARIGSGSEYDVLLAQSDMNADSAAVVREGILINDARMLLLRVMGVELPSDFGVTTEIRLEQVPEESDVLQTIYDQNARLELAQIRQRIASLERRELLQGRLPRLEVNAGYNINNRETSAAVRTMREVDGYRYGITLRIPVIDGLNMNRKLQAARLSERNARLEQEEELHFLRSIARAEYHNYTGSIGIVTLEEQSLALANETLAIALERFRLGTITSLELRESQRTLINTETRLISALYEAKVSEVELLRLMGRLLD
jgi:outer membrane protein